MSPPITNPEEPKKYWYLKNAIPKLDDDLRGRIVLIRAYDPTYDQNKGKGWSSGIKPGDRETYKIWPDGINGGGLEWNGFNIDGTSKNSQFKTQNGWQAWHGTQKGSEVEAYIRSAQQNAADGFLTLNFASYASDLGPGSNAQGMNPRIQKYLGNYDYRAPVGVIPVDFTGNTGDGGDSLENRIIEHQAHQKSDHVYGGIPDWLKAISA